MPLYEFECAGCEAVFEELVSRGADGSEMTCPECGAEEVKRVLSTFACGAEGGGGSGSYGGGGGFS